MPTSSTDKTMLKSFSSPAWRTAESSMAGLPLERMAVSLFLAFTASSAATTSG